jgi:hypothetical protein
MNAPDALPGYQALQPAGTTFRNEVVARVAPTIMVYRPGRAAKKIKFPILFCVSNTDSVTPPAQTLRYARTAPRGEIKRYEAGDGDYRVQAAQRVDRSRDGGAERVEVSDVTLDTDRALTEFGTQRRESVVASGQHRYRCTAAHQRTAGRLPDTAGGAGDEDAPSGEVRNRHVSISPSWWSPFPTNKR